MCRAKGRGARMTYHITAPSALAVYVWMGAASCSVTPPCATPCDACPPAKNASCVKRERQPTAVWHVPNAGPCTETARAPRCFRAWPVRVESGKASTTNVWRISAYELAW
jgi:hypothetical protein